MSSVLATRAFGGIFSTVSQGKGSIEMGKAKKHLKSAFINDSKITILPAAGDTQHQHTELLESENTALARSKK